MQAVILAAGASSRFYPLSESRVKDMVPMMGKPILERTILAIRDGGIKNIVLVVSNDRKIKKYFGDGENLSVNLTYVVQEKPLGMADGLLRAKDLIKDNFILLNAHHLDIKDCLKEILSKKNFDGVFLARYKANYWNYGVVEVDGERVIGVIEKPPKTDENSKLCLVGVYLLPKDFLNFLTKFPLEQYVLEKSFNEWTKEKNVGLVTMASSLTLKYPWDLFEIKDYLFRDQKKNISSKAKIGKNVIIDGEVVIEDGVNIMENAVIKGPAYIGKNVTIGNSTLIRNGTVLEENVSIGAFSDIKNSIFLPGAHLGGGFVASSIIGENSKLGHNFTTANKRFDRKAIAVKATDREVDTGIMDLGVIMGENVNCGIGAGTMPGIIIGSHSIIGPGTFVFKSVPPNTECKTEFKNQVKNKK